MKKLMKVAVFFAGVVTISNYLLKLVLKDRQIRMIGGADGPTAIYLTKEDDEL